MKARPRPRATKGRRDGGFAITVAFDLAEGAFPEFFRLVSENAARSVALEPDCLRFDVLTPRDGVGPSILLYEVYADEAAFDLHLASDHYLSFDRSTRDLVRQKTVTSFSVATNAKERGPA
jgi:(4S)-4-hydroxy-5-phosphonooxypentane-2,3-dione isomerase